jgi:hypothetical protein
LLLVRLTENRFGLRRNAGAVAVPQRSRLAAPLGPSDAAANLISRLFVQLPEGSVHEDLGSFRI